MERVISYFIKIFLHVIINLIFFISQFQLKKQTKMVTFLTSESGLPVNAAPIDSSCKTTFQYGTIGSKGPLLEPWAIVKERAEQLGARYILKTSSGSYYIKCFAPREGFVPFTSGKILQRVSGLYDSSGKSRVWIIDYP